MTESSLRGRSSWSMMIIGRWSQRTCTRTLTSCVCGGGCHEIAGDSAGDKPAQSS